MFDFEKFQVYQVVREQNKKILSFIYENQQKLDPFIADQLKRASLNSVLYFVEGTGKRNSMERRQLFSNARSSVFACTTILQIIKDQGLIDEDSYNDYYQGLEKASKMLLGMFKPKRRVSTYNQANFNQNNYQQTI